MSKLFHRARVKLENAEADYRKIREDDAYLDDCCFNLQQCIELLLKYAIEINGGQYARTHDIRAQMNVLNKLGVDVPNADLLRQNAQTLNDWEASSRYKDNFVALMEDIDIARTCAEDLLHFLEQKVKTEPIRAMELFPDDKLS